MPLYQNSVLNKFLKAQDKDAVVKAYKKFSKHFHNPKIQENIRNSKEEQYQEGFLRELFVDVFGYTLNPQPKFNLTSEFKNEKGAKKADGAILKDGKALGVIELKGTDTKDLEKVRQQAFDYKANQSECVYVITSNFEKLRFYINNAVEFEEFDLFTLTEKRFEVLYLSLAAENILNGTPLNIKEASVVEQENITKKFYADYSLFKRELFRDLVKKNLRNDVFRGVLAAEETAKADKNIKLNLFKKSQKLIDRFLFIFFAEDRGLLPPNSTHKILEDWNKLKDMDAIVPLYDRFKLYFNYLDTGRKGTDGKAEIFAYNGGLFKPDNTLDSLLLDDELLYKHTKKLSEYDFESQVDVNILGHIFENSLNEIESVNAEIEGTDFDKQKTKRKKDGVFYTPKYITKYIVDNTVGKLCQEKRAELGIVDEEFTAKRQKETKRLLLEKLDTYRAWLLELTICDPACGSGAFLNQALDFLIKEHESVDELQAALLGGAIVFQEIENTILEKNIYGVDLNEESVEIAKLSLWLRTAQPRRKLNDLNNNIKCGNSLIESKSVAGDKAFKWEDEFPEVFAKGGFDVVIGNPPYGIFLDDNEEDHYKKFFPLTKYKLNLYILFIERMFQIFDKGIVHFIIPKSLLFNTYFDSIREKLLVDSRILEIFMLTEKVFPDAEVGGSLILKFQIAFGDHSKNKLKLISADTYFDFEGNKCLINEVDQDFFLDIPHFEISPVSSGGTEILKKLHSFKPIKDKYKLKNGLNPGNVKDAIISNVKTSEFHKPIIWGKEFTNYHSSWGGQFINYNPNLANELTTEDIKSKEGMKSQTKVDFALRTPDLFEAKKIIVRKTGDKFVATLDNSNLYFDTLVHGIYQATDDYDLNFLLAILNSNPATKFYRLLHDIKGKVFAKISLDKLASFPLPTPSKELKVKLSSSASKMLDLHSEFYNKRTLFSKYILSQLQSIILNNKLLSWEELVFGEFIKELNKSIKGFKLSKSEEMEWMELFETKKKNILVLKDEIAKTEKEIDRMVYELYGLSEEEIKIVEGI